MAGPNVQARRGPPTT